ncbi:MAG: hypothetical protein KDH97_08310 [Calditrichaeota bacterium]|nr:hypothetical protein [Calditrichota bacterium]MCB0307355.1 hypothetical protein [Calditrichota bacterium]
MFFSSTNPLKSIRRPRASIKFCSLGIILLTLPLQYVPIDSDSSETNISLSGGTGSYGVVSRGCEGQVLEKHKINFSELGGSLDHKFAGAPLRIGVRSAYVNDRVLVDDINASGVAVTQSRRENILTINPFLNLEGKTVAAGIGYFYADHSLAGTDDVTRINPRISGYFRIGDRRKTYWSTSYLSTPAFYSQGYFQTGLGFGQDPKFDFWLGMSVAPYDKVGFLAKTAIRLNRQLYLNLNGRFGSSAEIFEHGVNVGLSYRILK